MGPTHTAVDCTPNVSAAARPRQRISVALLTGDSADFVGAMLASLAGQRRRPDEVVIHDGASADATLDVIRGFEHLLDIRVVRSDRFLPGGEARRIALQHTTGDLLAHADHDDFFLPDHFAELEALSTGAGRAVFPRAFLWRPVGPGVPGGELELLDEAWRLEVPPHPRQLEALAVSNFVFGAPLYHRADYETSGPGLRHGAEDWEQWLRMSLKGVEFVRPELPTVLYRWWHGNTSAARHVLATAGAAMLAEMDDDIRTALGATRMRRVQRRRAHRFVWRDIYEAMSLGEDGRARRLARQHLGCGDHRVLAAAVLPMAITRRLAHLD